MTPSTFLITGSTRGYGLSTAIALAKSGVAQTLVLPVRTSQRGNDVKHAITSAVLPENYPTILTPIMEQESLSSVASCVEELLQNNIQLDGVLLNAGILTVGTQLFSQDSYELNIAVNHLSHYTFLTGIMPLLAPNAITIFVACEAYDPNRIEATRWGFRGSQFTSFENALRGVYADPLNVRQTSKDAYATSKMCNIVSAQIFARRFSNDPRNLTFLAMEPGYCTATGLSRYHGVFMRNVTSILGPIIVRNMEGNTTEQQAGKLMHDFLLKRINPSANGVYFSMNQEKQVAECARDENVIAIIAQGSDQIATKFLRPTVNLSPITGESDEDHKNAEDETQAGHNGEEQINEITLRKE